MAVQISLWPMGSRRNDALHGTWVELHSPDPMFHVFVVHRTIENDLWLQARDATATYVDVGGLPHYRYGSPLAVSSLIATLAQTPEVYVENVSAQSLLWQIQHEAPQFVGTEYLVHTDPPVYYPAYGISPEHLNFNGPTVELMKLHELRTNPRWVDMDLNSIEIAVTWIQEYGFTRAPPPELIGHSRVYGPATQRIRPGLRLSKWDTIGFKPGPSHEMGRQTKVLGKERKPYHGPAVSTTTAPKKKRKKK